MEVNCVALQILFWSHSFIWQSTDGGWAQLNCLALFHTSVILFLDPAGGGDSDQDGDGDSDWEEADGSI